MNVPSQPDQDARRVAEVRALAARVAVAELVEWLDDPSWFVRREVVSRLGALGEAADLALLECLQRCRDNEASIAATVDALSASTSVQLDARLIVLVGTAVDVAVLADSAQVLGRRRSRTAYDALTRLTRHADDNVAVAAIEALGKLGGRAAVDALLACVESRHFFRTFPAIDVLGRSGDPRAVGPLIELLSDARYTFEAARALGRSADLRAVVPLMALLVSPSDGHVRVACVALSELCERYAQQYGTSRVPEDAVRQARSDAIVRRLGQSVTRADKTERVAIATLLGMLSLESATPTLLSLLEDEAEVATAAGNAVLELARSNDAVLIEALVQGNASRRKVLLPVVTQRAAEHALLTCLDDSNSDVRILACNALARVGATASVPRLFTLLVDSHARLVNAAIAAIQSLGIDQTEALALAAAQNPRSQRAALRVLAYFGFPSALPLFAATAHDPDPRLRDVALHGLSLIEGEQARDIVLKCCASRDAGVRAAAVRALGHRDDHTVDQRLVSALQDHDPWVRYYACQAVGRRKLPNVEAALGLLTQDGAGQVRVAAVEALAQLSTPLAVQLLRESAEHDDPDLRRAALLGLGMASDEQSLATILTAASEGDATTRMVALSALTRYASEQVTQLWLDTARTGAEQLRIAAISLLAERAGVAAAGALVELLLETEASNLLLHALSKDLPGRVHALESALARVDEDQAKLLVAALTRSHAADAYAALYRAVISNNPAVRRTVAGVLAGLRTPEARTVLEGVALNDPDPEVRRISQLHLESRAP